MIEWEIKHGRRSRKPDPDMEPFNWIIVVFVIVVFLAILLAEINF